MVVSRLGHFDSLPPLKPRGGSSILKFNMSIALGMVIAQKVEERRRGRWKMRMVRKKKKSFCGKGTGGREVLTCLDP